MVITALYDFSKQLKASSPAAKTIVAIVETLKSEPDELASATRLARIVLKQLPPSAEAQRELGDHALTTIAEFLDRVFKLDTRDKLTELKAELLRRTFHNPGELPTEMQSRILSCPLIADGLSAYIEQETPLNKYFRTILANLLPFVVQYIHFVPARVSRLEPSVGIKEAALVEQLNNPQEFTGHNNFNFTVSQETRLFNSVEILDYFFLVNQAQSSLSLCNDPKSIERTKSLPW